MSMTTLSEQTPATMAGALPVTDLPHLPPRPAADPNYRNRGTCATDPKPDRWVDLPPIRIKGKDNPDYDRAVADLAATCIACPVYDACLWDALAYDVFGVFAGTDEYTRADLRTLHELPDPIRLHDDEDEEDHRMRNQRFTARLHARHGLTNTQIAAAMNVSPMSVSRFLDERH